MDIKAKATCLMSADQWNVFKDPRVCLPLGILLLLFHLTLSAQLPNAHFEDPGIGWHLKSGELTIANGGPLAADPFSWTMPGKERIQYEWLSDVCFAWLVGVGGLPLFSAVISLLYGLIFYLLVWRMLTLRVHPVLALAVTMMAYLILYWHALARPHVFTYLFFLITLWILDTYMKRGGGLRTLWPLILIMLFWCNLHPGFVIGLIVIFLSFCGLLLEASLNRSPSARQRIPGIILTGILCGLITLINPYGLQLHLHIIDFLNLECLALWNEFQPPQLAGGNIHLLLFKVMLLLTLLLALSGRSRLRWDERILLIVLLHFAFQSVRHVNLFVLCCAPILALLLQRALAQHLPTIATRGRALAKLQTLTRSAWWGAAGVVAIGWIASTTMMPAWHGDRLSTHYFSEEALHYIEKHPEKIQRPFNNNTLGGSLTFHFYPDLLVFMDDRADLYQDDFVFQTYLPISKAETGWSEQLTSLGADSLILRKGDTLADAARKQPEWKLAYEDAQNVIFLRQPQNE